MVILTLFMKWLSSPSEHMVMCDCNSSFNEINRIKTSVSEDVFCFKAKYHVLIDGETESKVFNSDMTEVLSDTEKNVYFYYLVDESIVLIRKSTKNDVYVYTSPDTSIPFADSKSLYVFTKNQSLPKQLNSSISNFSFLLFPESNYSLSYNKSDGVDAGVCYMTDEDKTLSEPTPMNNSGLIDKAAHIIKLEISTTDSGDFNSTYSTFNGSSVKYIEHGLIIIDSSNKVYYKTSSADDTSEDGLRISLITVSIIAGICSVGFALWTIHDRIQRKRALEQYNKELEERDEYYRPNQKDDLEIGIESKIKNPYSTGNHGILQNSFNSFNTFNSINSKQALNSAIREKLLNGDTHSRDPGPSHLQPTSAKELEYIDT